MSYGSVTHYAQHDALYRGVVKWPDGRMSYYGPYDTSGKAQSQVTRAIGRRTSTIVGWVEVTYPMWAKVLR